MRGGEIFVPLVGAAPILDLARAVVEAHGTYLPGHICTGLRPGERLHETLISADEAANTYDRGGHYRIEPASCSWNEDRDPQGNSALVEAGFAYTSDTNPEQFTVEELRRLIA
jgi:UDP-N-acetylglucosamine 4,6-dehydratase